LGQSYAERQFMARVGYETSRFITAGRLLEWFAWETTPRRPAPNINLKSGDLGGEAGYNSPHLFRVLFKIVVKIQLVL
jgi:hypothetical protein